MSAPSLAAAPIAVSPQTPPTYPQQPVPIPPTPLTPVPERRWGTTLAVILGAIFFLVACASAGTYYYFHYESKDPYTQEQVVALIRENILPSVVQIGCAGIDGGAEEIIGTGIYTSDASGTPMVETNAHVVLGSDGIYHGCNVYFPHPEDGSNYESAYIAGEPALFHNVQAGVEGNFVEGIDFAALPLIGPHADATGVAYPFPPQKKDVLVELVKSCRKAGQEINIGDPVYVLGYPGTGGTSLTLTEGVVSGYGGQFNELLKVSAVTNHGNSGGIVIGAMDACYYGIPTLASFEQGGNLGFVLTGDFVVRFLSNLTGRSTYSPPETTTDPKIYLKHTHTMRDFTILYPDRWTVDTSGPNPDGTAQISFVSPDEGPFDTYLENLSITVGFDVSQAGLDEAISILQQKAVSYSSEATEAYLTLSSGVKVYDLAFFDESGQAVGVPAGVEYIVFLRNGSLYILRAVVAGSPNYEKYFNMMSGMAKSIEFK